MSTTQFINKLMKFNTLVADTLYGVNMAAKISTLNNATWYFTFLKKDMKTLEEKVERLEKENKIRKTSGCNCSCKKDNDLINRKV